MGLTNWVKQIAGSEGQDGSPPVASDSSATASIDLAKTDAHAESSKKAPDERWIGFIDRVRRDVIEGWAYDSHNPSVAVVVEAVAGPGKSCVAMANIFRDDVLEAGHGTGKYGFRLDLGRLSLKNDTVIVRFADSGHLISAAPIEFDAQHAVLHNDMPTAYEDAMILIAALVRRAYEERGPAVGHPSL